MVNKSFLFIMLSLVNFSSWASASTVADLLKEFDETLTKHYPNPTARHSARGRLALQIAETICPDQTRRAYMHFHPVEDFRPLQQGSSPHKLQILREIITKHLVTDDFNWCTAEAFGRLAIVGFNEIDLGAHLLVQAGKKGCTTLQFALRDAGNPASIEKYLSYFEAVLVDGVFYRDFIHACLATMKVSPSTSQEIFKAILLTSYKCSDKHTTELLFQQLHIATHTDTLPPLIELLPRLCAGKQDHNFQGAWAEFLRRHPAAVNLAIHYLKDKHHTKALQDFIDFLRSYSIHFDTNSKHVTHSEGNPS